MFPIEYQELLTHNAKEVRMVTPWGWDLSLLCPLVTKLTSSIGGFFMPKVQAKDTQRLRGGKDHLNFRKEISINTNTKKDTISSLKSYKIPLDSGNYDLENISEKFKSLFSTVRGVNGLKRYLFLLIASGFRPFSNATTAKKMAKKFKSKIPSDIGGCAVAYDSSRVLSIESGEDTEKIVYKVCFEILADSKYAPPLKEKITTYNSNALSWIFGKGFKYFLETDIGKIKKDFGITKSSKIEKNLKELKELLPKIGRNLGVLKEENFSAYRKIVAGDLDSWLTNFEKVFSEVREMSSIVKYLEKVDKVFSKENLKFLAKKNPDIADQINEFVTSFHLIKENTFRLDSYDQFDLKYKELYELVSYMNGNMNRLINYSSQLYESEKDKKTKSRLKKIATFKIKKDILPKLNNFGGAGSELGERYRDNLAKVRPLIASLVNIEKYTIHDLKSLDESDFRKIIEKVCNISKRLDRKAQDELFKALKKERFTSTRNLAQKIYQNKGKFFLTEKAKNFSRHKEYEIFRNIDFLKVANKLIKFLKKKEKEYEKSFENRDLINFSNQMELKRLLLTLGLELSCQNIKKTDFFNSKNSSLKNYEILKIKFEGSENLQDKLNKAIKPLMGTLFSELLWNGTDLLKTEKVEKVVISRIKWEDLFLSPKDRNWKINEKTKNGKGPIGEFFRANKIEGHAVNLSKELADCTITSKEILKQAPMDIFVPIGLGEVQNGCFVRVGKIISKYIDRKENELLSPMKLVIPKHWRCDILDGLLNLNDKKVSEYSLIFEMKKSFKIEEKKITEEIEEVRPYINIPITTTHKVSKVVNLPFDRERIVSFDMGEVAFGFSVIETKTGKIIESGKFKVTTLKRLRDAELSHRKFKQVGTKRYQESTYLRDLRDAAVGDLKFLIDRILKEFKGIPVFEYEIRNLESGSRRIKSVYEKLTKYYTYSEIDAHKSERVGYWLGANMWTIKKGKNKMNLFPGGTVSAAGTSQSCSVCGVNPIKLIRTYEGEIVEGESIVIEGIKLSSSWGANKKQTISKIRKILRTGKVNDNFDTTQSQYNCINNDCGIHIDADENAAINIALRFKEKLNKVA